MREKHVRASWARSSHMGRVSVHTLAFVITLLIIVTSSYRVPWTVAVGELSGRLVSNSSNKGPWPLWVRSANLGPASETTSKRTLAILEAFRSGGKPIGVVGFQEDGHPKCGKLPCIVQQTASLEGIEPSQVFDYSNGKNLSLLVTPPWAIIERGSSFKIGRDKLKYRWSLEHPFVGAGGGYRYMAEVVIKAPESPNLRVFTAHLSHHSDQQSERNKQIKELIRIVKSEYRQYEGLPLVVGDFNFKPDTEPQNFNLMNNVFELVASNGLDHIWVGRPEAFPQHAAIIQVENQDFVNLPDQMFDHESPFVTLTVIYREPPGLSGCSPGLACCKPGNSRCVQCLAQCPEDLDSGCPANEFCCEPKDPGDKGKGCRLCSKARKCP